MFGKKRKDKCNPEKLSDYPCDIYLHNALNFVSQDDTDSAYTEICYAIMKSGGELSDDELEIFHKIIDCNVTDVEFLQHKEAHLEFLKENK